MVSKSFTVKYDHDGDVLYISTSSTSAARGEEEPLGIVWRFNGSGLLIGATILDFVEDWCGRRKELAAKLSDKFGMPKRQFEVELDHALERRMLLWR